MERIERIGPRTEGPGGVLGVSGPVRVEQRDDHEAREERRRRQQQGKRREPPAPERPVEPGHVDLMA